MAEEAPGIQNKGLLLVAIVLAAIVVGVYKWRMWAMESAREGDKVKVLRVRTNMDAGARLTEKDLYIVEVDAKELPNLGNIVTADKINSVKAYALVGPVKKDQFLYWQNLLGGGEDYSPIEPGMVGKTLTVDPKCTPGELLRVGAKVNVLGMLPRPEGGMASQRIIEGLKVLAIGGKMGRGTEMPTGKSAYGEYGIQTYQMITVMVTPEVSLQLDNIKTWVQGEFGLELANPTEGPDRRGRPPQINDSVKQYADAAFGSPTSRPSRKSG